MDRLDKFWSQVEKSDCWTWIGTKDRRGYGSFYYKGQHSTHRASWIIHYGEIPKGLCVLHQCDNPSCVRPDHLMLGTYNDNAQDAVFKGRNTFGENHPEAKLTRAKVDEIRRLYNTGQHPMRELGDTYGVSHQSIFLIIHNQMWKNSY